MTSSVIFSFPLSAASATVSSSIETSCVSASVGCSSTVVVEVDSTASTGFVSFSGSGCTFCSGIFDWAFIPVMILFFFLPGLVLPYEPRNSFPLRVFGSPFPMKFKF
ncbi:MAG: hypothetical protein AMS27_09665 [Bacteroides sp. SM23_62_1]|nr:MAG: hypothetical protein AMS27_09665 [Bacteroides sp. SM23_62_1]